MRYPDKNQLTAIYVLPECQGQGIGKQLWAAILPFFDPEKPTTVELADYNAAAIAFYEKLGFKDAGKRFRDETYKMKSGATIPLMEMSREASG